MTVDFRNIEIMAGDRVAYPVRKGSSLWLNEGIVNVVHPDGSIGVENVITNKSVTIIRTDRVIVLER